MAIAFDATATGVGNPTTSLTISHTCSGSNRVLFLHIQTGSDATPTDLTSVTYAGQNMTLVDRRSISATEFVYLYYIINPASGTNDIVISRTTSGFTGGNSASYTGAQQSGIPDASTTNSGASPLATSITTIADNCWAVIAFTNGSGNFGGITGGTARQSTSGRGIADSNAAITPAGNKTITIDGSGGTIWAVMASFAPAVAVAATTSTAGRDFMLTNAS